MTTPRDPDRLIRLFLDEGQTELPDRSYDAVRAHIDQTRQRVVIGPWREPRMTTFSRLAIGAAAVVLAAVVGINVLPGGQGGLGATPPSATPPPSQSPASALVTTIVMSEASEGDLKIQVTIPTNWTDHRWGVAQADGEGPYVGLSPWAVEYLYKDACRTQDGPMDPPVGPTVDDLVAAFVAQPTLETTTPTAVTLAGYSGTYLEVTVPASCTTEVKTMVAFGGAPRLQSAGEVTRLWILDVDGRRAVIDATRQPGVSARQLAELEAVIESVKFVR